MIDASALRRRHVPIDRSSDRLVALVSIALAIGFLVAAVLASVLPASVRLGAWLPLHLALAGGASTAIAGVMPFFVAALAAAPPIDPRLRLAAVLAVAAGAITVSLSMAGGRPVLAAAGGVLFVAGVILVGAATVRPLTRGLGPGRGLITYGYLAALASVMAGALLATLFVVGWAPIAERWPSLRTAHAWLNLVGFVSVVIATTLLHFFPTVVGSRIGSPRMARFVVAGLFGGSVTVAGGAIAGIGVIQVVGGLIALGGAVALAGYGQRVWAARARWTTDPGWHAFVMGGLVSAIGWFLVGMAVAAGRLLATGGGPSGWSIEALGGPLVVGWMGIAVVASASHLLPAVGPGDQAAHARQRNLLGRWSVARLAVINVGVTIVSLGLAYAVEWLTVVGVATVGIGLAATAGLLAGAIALGIRPAGRRQL